MAASAVPVLYMFPLSYYSQKARLAIREKGIKCKEVFISLRDGTQNTVWYLRLNPNGQVPMLQLGDQFISESERIIDLVDQLPSDSKVKLVPASGSPEATVVEGWRRKLDTLDCGNLTYGVVLNPELSVDGLLLPPSLRPNKESFKIGIVKTINNLKQIQEKHPDLKEVCRKKIELSQKHAETFGDKGLCTRVMNDLEDVIDDVEHQLKATKSRHPTGHWLCGANFTAADITLCVLLGRLRFIGVLSRYVDADKRPELFSYWKKAQERPTVNQTVIRNLEEMKKIFLKKFIVKSVLVTAGVGIASVGIWAAYKHFSQK